MQISAYTPSFYRISSSKVAGPILAVLVLLTSGSAAALPEDSDQPIHIRADTAEIDNQAETVIYRGSVQVDQGTLRVTADEMTIEYEDQKVIRIIAVGNPAKLFSPDKHEEIWEIQEPLNFPLTVYGYDRPEATMVKITQRLSEHLGSHIDDTIVREG